MRLINQDCTLLLPTGYALSDIYKHIELAGRTCYKSEDKITDESAEPFVNRLVVSKHGAMLEHGPVYLKWDMVSEDYDHDRYNKYKANKYSIVRLVEGSTYCYVTTNYRVIVENEWDADLKYLCEPTENHELRVTVKFTINRQVSHEFVRHRVMSFGQESTRYCNYIKDKFGGNVTFIIPNWLNYEDTIEFEQDLQTIESIYFKWINKGWTAQQAATFLPNATKVELVMTGTLSDWDHFFDLRFRGTTGAPHPQAKEAASIAYKLFEENNLLLNK